MINMCGAKTRAGKPCKITTIYENGRCKFHGGLSTGPKTVEGKKRSSMNAKKHKNSEKNVQKSCSKNEPHEKVHLRLVFSIYTNCIPRIEEIICLLLQ